MATRLELYNGALLLCGERFLSALTEDREPRRLLDHVWDADGVRYCLEQGEWQFAMRTQQISQDPSIEPPFGYQYAFNKPTDWVATHAVCQDEFFNVPLTQYADEGDNWYAEIDPIYVKFVSDDADYGNDLAGWPQSFAEYVEAFLASKIVYKLNGNPKMVEFLFGKPGDPRGGELHRRLLIAKNKAAFTQPTRFPAESSWNSSRRGRSNLDRGNRGSLLG